MDKSWVPIVVGFIALLVGWGIGFFDSNMRTAKKIRAAEARAKFEIERARMKVEESAKSGGSSLVAGQANLLRLWNDPDKKLKLELDGKPADRKTLTAKQQHRLVDVLAMLRPWQEGLADSTPPPTPLSVIPEPQRPILNPVVSAALAGGKASPEPVRPASPASIIDQINVVLQKNLAGTELEKKGIRLQESLSGTLWIYVGLKRYDGIDAVPEEAIQAVIRQAVAEWERMNA